MEILAPVGNAQSLTAALRSGADASDPEQVVPLLDVMDIRMDYGPDGEQRMMLDGEDVSAAIR